MCSCGAVVSSKEFYNLEGSIVLLSNNDQVSLPFIRERLFISIYESCRHRPTAITDAIGITETVIAQCLASQKPEGTVNRLDLILITRRTLMQFDAAAGMYYAAYHK